MTWSKYVQTRDMLGVRINDSKSIGYDKTTSPGDGTGDGTELRAVSGLNAAMSSKLSNRG